MEQPGHALRWEFGCQAFRRRRADLLIACMREVGPDPAYTSPLLWFRSCGKITVAGETEADL